ncbi:hypothetical protein SAMN05442782_0838 [Streptomyces sp. OK228]|nr:hypothetical protein SAMN05442782_0838 [Streptomyces sp. OK228]
MSVVADVDWVRTWTRAMATGSDGQWKESHVVSSRLKKER